MASPAVEAAATTANTGSSSSPSVALPSIVSAGSLLIVFCYTAGAGAVGWPAGWTELFEASGTSGDVLACAYRDTLADGSEAGTSITVTHGAIRSVFVSESITGAADPATQAPEVGTAATGSSLTPNPPSRAVTGGPKDILALAVAGLEGENGDPTVYPSNYTHSQVPKNTGTAGSVGSNCSMAVAARQVSAASSEDPGTFTWAGASDQWVANTVVIHPAGATAYTLDAQPGSYAITGAAATPVAGRVLNASPGSYSVAGAATTLARGFMLDASPGSYAITGAAATPLAARSISADPGSYSVSGAAAQLAAGRLFSVDPGSFAVTGADASVLAGRVIAADPGSYVLTGVDANLVYVANTSAFELDAQPGSFSVVGAQAGVLADRSVDAQPGVYAVTGAQAAALADRMIIAAPGEYTLSGVAANLVFSGAPPATSRQRTLTGMGT